MVDRHAYDCLCQECLNADVSACNTAKTPCDMRPAALACEIMRLRDEKSTWDRVGAAIERLALLNGGKQRFYKPVVRVAWYDHDGQATVEVGQSKGVDDDLAIFVDVIGGSLGS